MRASPRPATAIRLDRARATRAALETRRHESLGLGTSRDLTLFTLATGLGLLYLYCWALYRHGPYFAAAVVGVTSAFLGTLLLLEVGLGVLILSMLLSPEVTVASVGLRGLTLRLEDLMIPVVALAWLARKALGLEKRELRQDPILVLMLGFVAVQVFSSCLGAGGGLNLATSFLYILKGVEYFAIFYFAFQYVDSERRIAVVLSLSIVAAVVVSIYNSFLIPSNRLWTVHRISAPFEGHPEPSSIGGYFVLVMALLLALALEAEDRRIRQGLLAVFVLILVPFVFTLSRASYVAFLVMLVAIAGLRRSRTLFAILAVALVLAPFLLPQPVLDRVAYTFQNRNRVLGYFDSSLAERIYIWRKVGYTLDRHPLLGRGVTAENVLDSYYARVLIETGVLGLAGFGAIVIRLWRIAGRVRRGHPQWWARGLALGYAAGLFGLLTHALSSITFVIVRIMEPFWLVSGILAALAHSLDRDAAAAEVPAEVPAVPALIGRTRHHG